MNIEVAFLWHFHQPIYSKPDDRVMPLPWVRLHALKDYLDMLKHIQKFPGIRATFNFTPSLLKQIQDYGSGACTDRQFELFRKDAGDLTVEEKTEILRDFFLANWTTMIEPYPRYFSLLMKRGKNIVDDELAAVAQGFTVDEFRDLQVWANLVWIDPIFRDEISDLYKQGRGFHEQDKDRIVAQQNRILSSIIDEYKKAYDSGQIELITSPMYHPILPLLINSDLAKVANPNLDIPFQFKHPEDARRQLELGIALFEHCFGKKPAGIWPSEGSVCEELIPILSDLGVEWIAADEEILARSLSASFRRDENGIPTNAAQLYKPWQIGKVKMIFRDHTLSDMIAFNYNTWDQKKAAQDLVGRIKTIGNSLSQFDSFLLPIILDGENAWEFFAGDGSEFLDCLYEELLKEKVTTTTISDYLHAHGAQNKLTKLFPGSWIGANFNIWMGRPQDHKAWKVLKDLREKLVEKNITDPAVWDRFYILEGSDWYWWFGDDFFSVTGEVFDELFRLTAIWIYNRIGEKRPHELFSSINTQDDTLSQPPIDRIKPVIDGRVTHFYEWFNAGRAEVKRMGGTMQRFAGLFSAIHYGFDERAVYVRCDVINHDIGAYQYSIDFYKPKNLKITLDDACPAAVVFKVGEIIEVSVPYEMLGIDAPSRDQAQGGKGEAGIVEFVVRAREKTIELDRTPLLRFSLSLKELALQNWSV
ncbi:MAG TPA: glycoside hydrolase family 57 protein [bacterium]